MRLYPYHLVFIVFLFVVGTKQVHTSICPNNGCFFGWRWCPYRDQCDKLVIVDGSRATAKVNGISSACVKENGKWELKIKWNAASNTTNLQHYTVNLREEQSEVDHCVCFNASTKTSFVFREKYTFNPSKNYDVTVEAIPVKPGQSSTSKTVKGCPRRGEYMWTAWGKCECQDIYYDYCIGKRRRSQICVLKTNNTVEVFDDNCDERRIGDTEETCQTTIPTTIITPTTITKKIPIPKNLESTKGELGVTIVAIVASVFGTAVFVMIYLFVRYRKIKSRIMVNFPEKKCKRIYASYYHSNKKTEPDLLANLLCQIRKYVQVELDVDFLSQLDIDKDGGYHRWIPEKVMASDVFMIILTKDYLRVYKDSLNEAYDEECDEGICKIRNELEHVSRRLHITFQREPQMVLVLCDVKPDELQSIPIFCARPYHLYPKKFDSNDDDFRKIVGLLSDIEPVQISPV